MKNMLWILLDLIPMIIAFQVEPPALGFTIGLLLAFGLFVFQKRRFQEVNTIIKVKVVYFAISIGVVMVYPGINLYQYTQLLIYGILTLTTVLSLLVRRPFTLQYAKKTVAPELWTHPLFIATNYWMSVGWAATFAISFLFSLLYMVGIIPGAEGLFLSNIWNTLGFVASFITPALVRSYARRKTLAK